MKKIALVLSGGGAKGAFQVGALNYIYEKIVTRYPDFKFSIIAGVSVGSLNGVMLAQNQFTELQKLWNNLENKDIYKGRINIAGFVWRLLRGKKSLLSSAPLEEKINQSVFLERMDPAIQFRAGAVSLVSGEYQHFQASQFTSNKEFRKAILASALMPVIWEPVDQIITANQQLKAMVDGGIRNINPLQDVLEFEPDEVVIINCSPFEKPLLDDPTANKSLFQIAKRSLVEIAMNEIFLGDIKEYLKINRIILQAKDKGFELKRKNGKPFKAYKTILINPEDYLGDVLNFEQFAIQPRIKAGYLAAEKAFAEYSSTSGDQLHTNLDKQKEGLS